MSRTRIRLSGRRTTTICRSLVLLAWGGAGVARAADVPSEGVQESYLVRAALSLPVAEARLRAVDARNAADGTAPPAFANPSVQGRHEAARGPAGASTDAVTASWSFGLGFASVPERRAASLTRASSADHRRAAVAEVVCAVRRGALDLWTAEGRRSAVEEGHQRFGALVARLQEMAQVGQVAGYDVARVRLADTVHRADRDRAIVAAERARSDLAVYTVEPVAQVVLLPVTPHPALLGSRADLAAADPILTALEREEDAAALRLAAAERAALPDIVLFGGTRWDAPPGTQNRTLGWEAGGALSVPVFARNQRGIADAEATLAQASAQATARRALLAARVEAATRRLSALGDMPPPPPADLWAGAVDRYIAGEASIDELLVVAGDVEAARLARIDGERVRRAAHLDLACALATFPEPELRPLLDEALR